MTTANGDSLALTKKEQDVDEVDAGVNSIRLGLRSFLESSKFSDMTIKTSRREFKVHRLVVCGQSEYFNLLYSREWKETGSNVVDLTEDDPDAIEAMIHFLYGNDYDSSGNDDDHRMSPLLFAVKVYEVADKFGILALQELSNKKFDYACETCWDMDDFTPAIRAVYSHAQMPDLQKAIARISHEHLNTLLLKSEFLQALESTEGFAADVLRLMSEDSSLCSYRCPNCTAVWKTERLSGTYYYCLSCGSRRTDWMSYIVNATAGG